jgi:hypothetical protein
MLPFFEKGQGREWLYQNLIALDQQINTLFNGKADETISARCYRCNDRNPYKWMEKCINWLYKPLQGPDHCKHAYEKEFNGRQRPAPKDA